MQGNCKCPHHWGLSLLIGLAGLSALGFWWASAFKEAFLWMDADHFFKDVVILSLLVFLSRSCGCCGAGGNACAHGEDCNMCK